MAAGMTFMLAPYWDHETVDNNNGAPEESSLFVCDQRGVARF